MFCVVRNPRISKTILSEDFLKIGKQSTNQNEVDLKDISHCAELAERSNGPLSQSINSRGVTLEPILLFRAS